MLKLERYKKYSRKDIHDIFSPNTNFTSGTGYWGLQGILKVPNSEHDYIFLVTYGREQAGHKFNENIDENGILTWQSQPQQKLNSPIILDLINHNYKTDNIYLFLRENAKDNYTYMGLLAYIDHDNQREQPVYFRWQILNWNENNEISYESLKEIDKKTVALRINNKNEIVIKEKTRKGNNTKDFYNNVNVDFEGEIRKNTILGNKGEDSVVVYEKNKLKEAGREDLAERVSTTRMIAGNAERFDVLSFESNGQEKYIEVKTTRGNVNNYFHISENEIQFSEKYSKKYYLYRLFNFNVKTFSADLKIQKGAVNRNNLLPIEYIGKIGEKNESV